MATKDQNPYGDETPDVTIKLQKPRPEKELTVPPPVDDKAPLVLGDEPKEGDATVQLDVGDDAPVPITREVPVIPRDFVSEQEALVRQYEINEFNDLGQSSLLQMNDKGETESMVKPIIKGHEPVMQKYDASGKQLLNPTAGILIKHFMGEYLEAPTLEDQAQGLGGAIKSPGLMVGQGVESALRNSLKLLATSLTPEVIQNKFKLVVEDFEKAGLMSDRQFLGGPLGVLGDAEDFEKRRLFSSEDNEWWEDLGAGLVQFTSGLKSVQMIVNTNKLLVPSMVADGLVWDPTKGGLFSLFQMLDLEPGVMQDVIDFMDASKHDPNMGRGILAAEGIIIGGVLKLAGIAAQNKARAKEFLLKFFTPGSAGRKAADPAVTKVAELLSEVKKKWPHKTKSFSDYAKQHGYIEPPTATIEISTAKTPVQKKAENLYESLKAKVVADPNDKQAAEALRDYEINVVQALQKSARGKDNPFEQVAEVVTGKKRKRKILTGIETPTIDEPYAVGGYYKDMDGNLTSRPNVRVPIPDFTPDQRKLFNAIIGRAWKQESMASAQIKAVDAGAPVAKGGHRIYSIFVVTDEKLGKDDSIWVALHEALPDGIDIIFTKKGNGYKIDVLPNFSGQPNATKQQVVDVAKKIFPTQKVGVDDANYFSAEDIDFFNVENAPSVINNFKKELKQDAIQKLKKILGSEREASRYIAGQKSEVAGKLLPNKRKNAERIRSGYRRRIDSIPRAEQSAKQVSQDYRATQSKWYKKHATQSPGGPGRTPPLADVTSSPKFKKWFKDSKVVDEQGKPLVVYHGTEADENFSVFGTAAEDQLGAHFGSKETANTRLKEVGPEFGFYDQRVIPVYLNIKNPLRMGDAGDFENSEQVVEALRTSNLSEAQLAEIINVWKNAVDDLEDFPVKLIRQKIEEFGYDGVVYKNTGEGGGDSYITFHPEQIKSKFNPGTFDPANPNIAAGALAVPTVYDE